MQYQMYVPRFFFFFSNKPSSNALKEKTRKKDWNLANYCRCEELRENMWWQAVQAAVTCRRAKFRQKYGRFPCRRAAIQPKFPSSVGIISALQMPFHFSASFSALCLHLCLSISEDVHFSLKIYQLLALDSVHWDRWTNDKAGGCAEFCFLQKICLFPLLPFSSWCN